VIAVSRLRVVSMALIALAVAAPVAAQSGRQVKVLVEFKQQTQGSRQGVQGQGGIVVEERRGEPRVRGRGGLAVEDTTTRVTRSSGLFTVVQDGGAGSIMVAQDVPSQQMAYYYDYATGKGHVAQGVAWQRVGTALSYFTPGGGGTIEVVEAATDVIVPNGGRLQFGGSTGSLHAITRQVLGYRSQQSSEETALTLTATIQ
jgi:hypothetical protein